MLARGDGSRPDGSFFLHRMTGEHDLPQAGSPLTDGRSSLEIKRRVALCGARESAAPAAGAKRKGHLRFPFLFGLLPFPCQLVWRRLPTCDRCENRGTAEDFFFRRDALRALMYPRIRSVRYHYSATQAGNSTLGAA